MKILPLLTLLFVTNGLGAFVSSYDFSALDGFEDDWTNSFLGEPSQLNKNGGMLAF